MKILLLLLLIGGCAHRATGPELTASSKEDPKWLYAPYEGCSEANELCATGEAKLRSGADAEAKKNLASIFEVKIQSDLNIYTRSNQTYPWQAQVTEDVDKSVKESVEQVLEAVEIKNSHKKDGLTYSLASLDKGKANALLRGRMNKIDSELSVLWENRQRTNFRNIVRLFQEREKLNERYAIINGAGKASPVSFEQIVRWKNSRPETVPLVLKIGQAPEWLSEKVKELLSEAGFRLVKSGADQVVAMNVESIKEFLNVEGFEKYTFTLNMTSMEKGEKKKVISSSETVTGRSQADALLKVRNYFNEYVEQHLPDLHLD